MARFLFKIRVWLVELVALLRPDTSCSMAVIDYSLASTYASLVGEL